MRDGSWTYSADDRDQPNLPNPKDSYFSIKFHQGQNKYTKTARRATLYDVFKGIGALIAFVLRFGALFIGSRQDFSVMKDLSPRDRLPDLFRLWWLFECLPCEFSEASQTPSGDWFEYSTDCWPLWRPSSMMEPWTEEW